MNRLRATVRNFFRQANAVVDLTHSAWNGIGSLVFQTARVILAQVEAMVIGILDIVDGLVTGTYRAFVPKRADQNDNPVE